MTVIAMTREMGTLGKDIATGLADSLDLAIVHHELVEHDLAEKLGVQESTVHQYLEGSASLLERWKIDKRRLSRYTAVEILELAQRGNVVIRGWGATALLRDIPHVLCVRVCAPMGFREQVMKKRLGVEDLSTIRREIERSDAAHTRAITRQFDIDWEDPTHYHMVLNTGRLPVEGCVRALRLFLDSKALEETPASRAALADKLIEWRARSALMDRQATGMRFSGLDISVKDCVVMLYGTASSAPMATLARQVVSDIPGVKDVESRIVVLRNYGGI